MKSHFEKNLILIGSYNDSLDAISHTEDNRPNLVILDLSYDFLQNDINISLNNRKKIAKAFEKKLNFFGKDQSSEYFEDLEILSSKILSILDDKGFFAIKINGTIKHYVKAKIDQVFGINRFLNEIIVNSPFIITYALPNDVIERTDYILLYCKSKNPRLNPVFNDKDSGGYWHSFVSKGQGTVKKFLFNDQLVSLQPPVGTHWKLKQETILKLCKEGKIRLNRNGNPEYWVPEKKGQIIDSNWLDLGLILDNSNDHFSHSDAYTRLFNLLITSNSIVLEINPVDSLGLVKAAEMGLRWICLILKRDTIGSIEFTLEKNGIQHQILYIQENKKENDILSLREFDKSFYSDKVQKLVTKCDLIHKCTYLEKRIVKGWANVLIRGDCIHILRLLQKRYHKSIKLVYIDPPFYTGIDEVINIPIGVKSHSDSDNTSKYSRSIDSVAYQNILRGETPIEDFKSWFKERVSLMKPLLCLDGFIFVRFDYHFGHYAKIVLDEVFSPQNFVIEFLVRRMKKNLSVKQQNQQTHLIVHNDYVFVYRASEQAILKMENVTKRKRKSQNSTERVYPNDNVWLDIAGYQKVKKTIYPTENSEILLKRIIEISTSPGDLVADFFAGSGTTPAVAEKLERKWIGVDIGSQSIHEIRKRLLEVPSRMAIDYFEVNVQDQEKNQDTIQIMSDSLQIEIKTSIMEKEVTVSIRDYINKTQISDLKVTNSYVNLIDYWEIDWNYNGSIAVITWYSKRSIKSKVVLTSVETSVTNYYSTPGLYRIYANVIDIFGNSIQRIFKVQI